MGCDVSKFDIAKEEAALPCRGLSSVHRRNGGAVVDSSLLSKPLPEGGKGEEHEKVDNQHVNMNMIKKVKSGKKGEIQRDGVKKDQEACDKEESGEDRHNRYDSIEYPRSLSFGIYCISSISDDNNSGGDANAGKIKDEQQGNVEENNKKASFARLGRKTKIGKGIKNGSAKAKGILF